MGPRLFSRGRRAIRSQRANKPSFNGAAALQPRKDAMTASSSRARSCFNGAAALQPRKAGSTVGSVILTVASMGPRLFSRGRTIPPPSPTPSPPLQWGRGSSAAEGAVLRDLAPITVKLQWGRGSSAAEGSAVQGAVPRRCPASMGPRLFSRGRAKKLRPSVCSDLLQWGRGSSAAEGQRRAVFRAHSLAASMGPRLFSRGRAV